MFFLSWRQLVARKRQTLLILLGISFGTLLYVSISGVQLGMRKYMADQLLNNTAHVLVSGAEKIIDPSEVAERLYGKDRMIAWVSPPAGKRKDARLENYQGWADRLKNDPDVLDFSPRTLSHVVLNHGDFSSSVGLVGTLPDNQSRITQIRKYVKQGSWDGLKSGGQPIVIGSGVAKNLGVRVNQIVVVTSGKAQSRAFKVVGIVHFGNQPVDDTIAFAPLNQVQSLVKEPGRVSQIAVALFDADSAAGVADEWQMISTDKVEDWQEANKMFMEMIKVQDFTRYFITIAILIVAAFGIYNVLSIMINQKRREIAILRAIGYGPRRILELILYQGLLLGVSGGLIGLLLGYLMCLWIGSIDFNFEIGDSNHLIISYDWSIYVTAFVASNIAAIIASYLPAHGASRLTPMEIIRSE